LVELPSLLTPVADGDAVDSYPRWVSPSLPSVQAETGVSQVQILPARPKFDIHLVCRKVHELQA